jgi:hypothetical protein
MFTGYVWLAVAGVALIVLPPPHLATTCFCTPCFWASCSPWLSVTPSSSFPRSPALARRSIPGCMWTDVAEPVHGAARCRRCARVDPGSIAQRTPEADRHADLSRRAWVADKDRPAFDFTGREERMTTRDPWIWKN